MSQNNNFENAEQSQNLSLASEISIDNQLPQAVSPQVPTNELPTIPLQGSLATKIQQIASRLQALKSELLDAE